MPSPLALEYIAAGVLPSFKPMTRVGVFLEARSLSCFISWLVHSFPAFLLAIIVTPFYLNH